MSSEGPVSRTIQSPAVGIVGVVADISAVILLLNNQTSLAWAQRHIELVVILASVVIAGMIGLIDGIFRTRRARRRDRETFASAERQDKETIARLKETIARLEGTPVKGDVNRFAKFIEDLGPNSDLYRWLKHGYMVKTVERKQQELLYQLVDRWDRDQTGYHDPELDVAFTELRDGLTAMRIVIGQNYFSDRGMPVSDRQILRIPPEWEDGNPEAWARAKSELEEVHDRVMEAYATFVQKAHRKKLEVN